jgi:hypothetical protein
MLNSLDNHPCYILYGDDDNTYIGGFNGEIYLDNSVKSRLIDNGDIIDKEIEKFSKINSHVISHFENNGYHPYITFAIISNI